MAGSQAPISWSQDTFLIEIHASSVRLRGVIPPDCRGDSAPGELSGGASIWGAAHQIFYTMQSGAFPRIGLSYTTGQFFSFPRTVVYILSVLWSSLMVSASQATTCYTSRSLLLGFFPYAMKLVLRCLEDSG